MSPLTRTVGPVLAGVIGAILTLRVLGPIKDPDTFWHIATGDHLRQTWEFVLADPFGSATEKQWILNQWLPELAMSWAAQVFGLPGVAWLLCLAMAGLFAALWVACRRRSSALVSALVVVVAFVAMSGSISPRPQVVTFALTVLTVDAWLRTADDLRVRWWLVPLTWVWACSHGMWFVGPVVGLAVLLGMLLERRVASRDLGRMLPVPLLSVVVAALTPVGPVLLTSPFQVSQVTAYITEWQPSSTSDPAFLATAALLLLVVIDGARHVVDRRWPVVLLAALAAVFAVTYGRTIAVAAAVLAPLAAAALSRLAGQPREGETRRETVTATVLVGLALALAALLAPAEATTPARGANGLDPQLAALPAGTVMCNDWSDGGWIIWRHPNLRVTMDPRAELYSERHIADYLTFFGARPGWQNYVEQTGCTHALLTSDAAAVEALRAQAGWTQEAAAGGYVLLRKPGA